MSPFALPGATCCIEGIGERKNVPGDQEVLITGATGCQYTPSAVTVISGHEIRAQAAMPSLQNHGRRDARICFLMCQRSREQAEL